MKKILLILMLGTTLLLSAERLVCKALHVMDLKTGRIVDANGVKDIHVNIYDGMAGIKFDSEYWYFNKTKRKDQLTWFLTPDGKSALLIHDDRESLAISSDGYMISYDRCRIENAI